MVTHLSQILLLITLISYLCKNFEKSYFEDINDYIKLENALLECQPEIIFHLAAQPLVRYGYRNPLETFQTNAMGTLNILNIARNLRI